MDIIQEATETNLDNIVMLTPATGSLKVTTEQLLFIHFNKAVVLNYDESLKIFNDDGSLFEEVSFNTDSLVDIQPTRIILDSVNNFVLGNSYYINFQSAAFGDGSAIIDDSWSFICGLELEKTELFSESINENFRLLIALPDSYHTNTNKSYKVVYITDGGFFNYSQYNEIATAYTNKEIEELITVGITYPEQYKINDIRKFRRRDFTQAPRNFLSFIKSTIIPYIDRNYRTQKGLNTLIGNSAGGYFVSYVLTTYREGEDFPFKYLFSVPPLHDFAAAESEMAAAITDLPVNFSLSIGSLDSPDRITAFNTFKDNLLSRNYPSFNFLYKIYKGMPHGEISVNASFADAFIAFFKPGE